MSDYGDLCKDIRAYKRSAKYLENQYKRRKVTENKILEALSKAKVESVRMRDPNHCRVGD